MQIFMKRNMFFLALTGFVMICTSPIYAEDNNPISLDEAVIPSLSDFNGFVYDNSTAISVYSYIGDDTILFIPREIDGMRIDINDDLVLAEGTHVRGIVWGEGFTSVIDLSSPNFSETSTINSVEAIRLASTMVEIGYDGTINPFSLPGLKTIEVADGNPVFHVEDGILYYKDNLVLYPALREGAKFTQPDDTYVLSGAFAGTKFLECIENFEGWERALDGSSIQEVVCSDIASYHDLNYNQFESENIKKITLPPNLTLSNLENEAFVDIPSLEEIIISDTNTEFFTDDGVLYRRREDGKFVLLCYPDARKGEEYHLLSGTAMIDRDAFGNPKYLRKLIIDDEVDEDTMESVQHSFEDYSFTVEFSFSK